MATTISSADLLLVKVPFQVSQDTQHVLTLSNILDENPLKRTLVMVEIFELDRSKRAQLIQSVVSSITLDIQLQQLHLLAAKLRHV